MSDEGRSPRVSQTMTGQLWACLAIGLFVLSWHALRWWGLLIPAACFLGYCVQQARRTERERDAAAEQTADAKDLARHEGPTS